MVSLGCGSEDQLEPLAQQMAQGQAGNHLNIAPGMPDALSRWALARHGEQCEGRNLRNFGRHRRGDNGNTHHAGLKRDEPNNCRRDAGKAAFEIRDEYVNLIHAKGRCLRHWVHSCLILCADRRESGPRMAWPACGPGVAFTGAKRKPY